MEITGLTFMGDFYLVTHKRDAHLFILANV